MLKSQIQDYHRHLCLFSRNARWFLVGTFFMGFGFSVFQLLLNLYLKKLGHQEGTIGSILSAASLGTVLVAIPAAIFVDHIRTKWVLLLAAAINFTTLVLVALSSSVWSLRILFGVSGAMFTVHWVAASPFFMRNSTPQERPYLFGVNQATETMAGFLGSLAGGALPRVLEARGLDLLSGYRLTLIGGVVIALPALLAYGRIRTEPPPRTHRFRISEYLGARDWKMVSRLTLPFFLIGLGAGLVIPFLNLYFLGRFHLASDAIGRIFSLGSLFAAAAFLAGPVIAQRIGLVKTVVGSELLSIPFFVVLAFSQNVWLSSAAFLMRGALMMLAWPMYNNFAMEMVPADQHAGTNSVMELAWNVAWMLSTNLGGLIIQRHGFTAVMSATIALYVTATTTTWLLFRRRIAVGRAAHPAPHTVT